MLLFIKHALKPKKLIKNKNQTNKLVLMGQLGRGDLTESTQPVDQTSLLSPVDPDPTKLSRLG